MEIIRLSPNLLGDEQSPPTREHKSSLARRPLYQHDTIKDEKKDLDDTDRRGDAETRNQCSPTTAAVSLSSPECSRKQPTQQYSVATQEIMYEARAASYEASTYPSPAPPTHRSPPAASSPVMTPPQKPPTAQQPPSLTTDDVLRQARAASSPPRYSKAAVSSIPESLKQPSLTPNDVLREARRAASFESNNRSPSASTASVSSITTPHLNPIHESRQLLQRDSLTPEDVLREARASFDNKTRGARTKRILQTAINASRKGEAQLRSTQEVLKLAGQVLPPNADLALASSSLSSSGARHMSPLLDHYALQDSDSILRCMSPTESSIGSIDDYDKAVQGLPSKLSGAALGRERMLNLIDGISHDERTILSADTEDDLVIQVQAASSPTSPLRQPEEEEPDNTSTFSYYLDYLLSMGDPKKGEQQRRGGGREGESSIKASLRNFSPLACGMDTFHHNDRESATIGAGVQKIPVGFAETINARNVDPRMPGWVTDMNHHSKESLQDEEDLKEYFYALGKSRTVIVHEIVRGNWTWSTAWSPDGSRLAVATENHHLAIIDTSSSTVWRVKHDRRITNPIKNNTTHSIRSIAWGTHFIAIGGTGNAVSILSPIEPYPIVHTIKGTGFVGTLDWRLNSSVLAVGSREDKCSLYKVDMSEDDFGGDVGIIQRVVSQELFTITRKDWVNVVTFSPGGSFLAIGDRSGKLTVYDFQYTHYRETKLDKITTFKFNEAVLDVEWSPDGLWLYAGGEDFAMTVIETSRWQVKHTVPRDRWMQFVSSSNRGTHVAVGGGASEVAILDALDGWKSALSIELKGLVPLSAKWHPRDQYLVVTGQDNSILAIETTNARHVKGHYLQSISPIAEVEFSPDGQMLAVGNEAGVVSFYRSDESSFVTAYEIVLAEGCSQSIVWSPNNSYVMVGSGGSLAIIGKAEVAASRGRLVPPQTSGLGIRKVLRDVGKVNSIAIHIASRYAAVVGDAISILDAANDFNFITRWEMDSVMKSTAWSLDGTWLVATGENSCMHIYDTSDIEVENWHEVFSLECHDASTALAWGPSVVHGLQYLAYGGDGKKVTVIEIRTLEGTWETVLEVERNGAIHDLDWSASGLLAVAIGDGTVTIIDLGYLKSGRAVNEMDYTWQRQGITCFTEIRRNRGTNNMSTIRWIPAEASEESLLAIGGSDGVLEVIDLTERSRCKGFGNSGGCVNNMVGNRGSYYR